MEQETREKPGTSRQAEEEFLHYAISVINDNLNSYGAEVSKMRKDIDVMLEHFHDDNPELIIQLENTITLYEHMKRALERNEKALGKPYFGRIMFQDETYDKEESLYIGRGGIASDATHQVIVDWRAPVASVYYENGIGRCSYIAPGGKEMKIDLKLKRTYEIEKGRLLEYFDSEVIANDELLTKYLAKNKQAVLGEIVATIQKEQNEIIRKSPYHNIIVQGVAGSGKTTVAMHRISFILYNYQERFKPEDFYIVGSNRILLNYITGVLPDLDVYGIRQMTMEQLFVRLIYEDWDEKVYGIRKSAQSGNRGSIKGGLGWFQDLKDYCDKLEWDGILRDSIYLNPKQFVEGLRDGKSGVYDETVGKEVNPKDLILLMDKEAVERYIRQNPKVSLQSKIDMLNDRLIIKIKEEFLGKGVKYSEVERKAILKAYRGRYGAKIWKGPSIYELYRDFLSRQAAAGMDVDIPEKEFDVYDLAALAYLYKRVKETEVISEAHHIVIDEAQDFGMMAYSVLHFCIRGCTYTVMGDVSQNIHFGFGLNDWEELKGLLLPDEMDSFGILKKSYRNTVEISDFAIDILHHGRFSSYPVEPIIRHGDPVKVLEIKEKKGLIRETARVLKEWKEKGFDTMAVVCRNQKDADQTAEELGQYVDVIESDLEKAVFGNGIMVLPVEYTKGLEFDTVLILDPDREDYPVDDGHAKLLYVASTRALHELCVLHTGNLTGLIADPLPEGSGGSGGPQPAESADKAAFRNADGAQSGFQKPMNRSAADSRRAGISVQSDGRQEPAGRPIADSGRSEASIQPGIRQKPKAAIRQEPTRQQQTRGTAPGLSDRSPVQTYSHSYNEIVRGQSASARESAQSSGRDKAVSGDKHTFKDNYVFGDMPATEKLRPIGHTKLDLSVRWLTKQPDGLYLQSRYGILRISPVGSAILRISFCKSGQPDSVPPAGIAVDRTEKFWMYKDSGGTVELTTDELAVSVNKSTGAIRYMTRDKKLLLAERSRECRLVESGAGGRLRTWLFLDWAKDEHLYGFGPADARSDSGTKQSGLTGISLRNSARYLSDGVRRSLPFLLSDKGYGIVLATEHAAFSCDIAAYGSYLYADCERQQDFYFIAGKKQDTILDAYEYLCGRR